MHRHPAHERRPDAAIAIAATLSQEFAQTAQVCIAEGNFEGFNIFEWASCAKKKKKKKARALLPVFGKSWVVSELCIHPARKRHVHLDKLMRIY